MADRNDSVEGAWNKRRVDLGSNNYADGVGLYGADGLPINSDGANNLNVNVVAGGITITPGIADNATFTEGSTPFAPVGGEYKSAPGAPTTGHAAAARITAKRALLVAEGGASFLRLAANTVGVAVLAAAGELHRVVINTKGATGNVLTLYDNASAASGTIIAVIDTTDSTPRQYDVHVANGIYAVLATGTAADITLTFEA